MDGQWMRKFEQEMHGALQERARLDERLARLHEEFQACTGSDTKSPPEQDRGYSHEGGRGASEACFGPEIEVAASYDEAYFLVGDLKRTVQELQKEVREKDNDIELLKATVSTLQGDLRHVQIQCEGRIAKVERSIAALEEAQASLGEAVASSQGDQSW
ncbi:uncharacterized protein LOC144142363 isoform X4 [Haemaphysalis longicornis]